MKVLGAYSTSDGKRSSISLRVSKSVVIDAGNILKALGEDGIFIDHIILTHSHLEHINDIPFLIDSFFTKRDKPLKIYGLKETLKELKDHILNWEIWPDFSTIPLINSSHNAVSFIEIEEGVKFEIDNLFFTPITTCHSVPTAGFIIEYKEKAVFFIADTTTCPKLWDIVNQNPKIKEVIIECSYASDLNDLAKTAKHMTPTLIREDLKNLKRRDIKILINHRKPQFAEKIAQEFLELDFPVEISMLDDNDEIYMV